VAPTYFYGNALGGYQDLQNGVLELPLPADRALQQLDRPDLGAFVELALRDPQAFTGHRIELASDAPTPTPTQMSAAMSGALGRPVRFTEVPMSSVRRGSPDMAAMWEFLRSVGYQADIAALHRDYPAVACPDVPSSDESPSCSSAQIAERQPAPSRRAGQDCMKASRSALIVWASVVGMPCGNPLYVFSVPFCTSRADSGPESA
jgi:NmrA-like family